MQMNWDAIGAIGEIVGAIAVVISLVYLASQIQLSNRASRRAAEQNLIDNQRIWLGRLSENEQLSDIWLRGSRNDPNLTEIEWIRFGSLCNEVTINWERSFLLANDGDVSVSIIERDSRTRRQLIGSPGYKKWFASRKFALTEEFANLVEKELASAEPYSVPYASYESSESET